MLKKAAYKGWRNCVRLANRQVELIVTGDVGPRIIRFGFVGGANEFFEDPQALGKRGGRAWRLYGGHRLWHAPEVQPRTYEPDNEPVRFEELAGGVRVIQPVEKTTGIEKQIEIRLHATQPRARLLHRLVNRGLWEVECAPWALSVMAPGGVCVFPLPPRGKHPRDLPPASSLTLWAYTDLSDPRWRLGRRFVMLRQDGKANAPQKIGALVPDGWAAYARNGNLFVKRFPHAPGAHYPDFGCNFETFTNRDMLEVETLAPLARLLPGQAAEHAEDWLLRREVPVPESETEIETYILPKVRG